MNDHCPICNYKMVYPVGSPKSDTLLIGEFPGDEEIKEGRPWVGEAGKILRAELTRAGIAYVNCRATNLWLHRTNDGCDISFHVDALMKEVEGKKYILLMGSELCKMFLDKGVSDLSGTITKFGGAKTVVCYNPAIAIHSSVGEVRLAIQRFAAMRRGK